ncbi:hypothetical protein [Rhodococcus zopfii]|uniref:hypothetical protein n=1 Tax=Rhodococcus zopfii TaxID=43772 RepID=UPI000ABB6474|nr:hypothetical protein [Rhodococcus zopfii]
MFKGGAARVERLRAGNDIPSAAPTTTASKPVGAAVPETAGGPAATDTETFAESPGGAPVNTGGAQ